MQLTHARFLFLEHNEVGLDFDGLELHALFSEGVCKPLPIDYDQTN
jgi:hypothetical protein